MRLINCVTLRFEETYQPQELRYAILSHRWQGDEVTYQDMMGDRRRLKNKQGWKKIKSFCAKALEQEMTHIWVDTCCIDKSSSAELSEAINSMYAWYCLSTVCHVYLYDFCSESLGSADPFCEAFKEVFAKSEWFYRGWTLQELIGPKNVLFYDCAWKFVATKAEMAELLSRITGIREEVLTGRVELETLPVAERMAWAGKRTCSRAEDTAYSLLGIFDINMPLLYGEGAKAFRRLQEEIIKQTNDHTIFVWEVSQGSKSSMLAPHPSAFNGSWLYEVKRGSEKSYAITNVGLSIQLHMFLQEPLIYLAYFDCDVLFSKGDTAGQSHTVGMYVQRDVETGIYDRIILRGESLVFIDSTRLDRYGPDIRLKKSVVIRLGALHSQEHSGYLNGFEVRWITVNNQDMVDGGLQVVKIRTHQFPWDWDQEERVMVHLTETCTGCVGCVSIAHGPVEAILLGLDDDFQPMCIVMTDWRPPGEVRNTLGRPPSRNMDYFWSQQIGWESIRSWNTDRWVEGTDTNTFYLSPPKLDGVCGQEPCVYLAIHRCDLHFKDFFQQLWTLSITFGLRGQTPNGGSRWMVDLDVSSRSPTGLQYCTDEEWVHGRG